MRKVGAQRSAKFLLGRFKGVEGSEGLGFFVGGLDIGVSGVMPAAWVSEANASGMEGRSKYFDQVVRRNAEYRKVRLSGIFKAEGTEGLYW